MSDDLKNIENLDRVEISKSKADEGCNLYQKSWNRRYLIGTILAFSLWRNRYYSFRLQWPVSGTLKNSKNLNISQIKKSIKESI